MRSPKCFCDQSRNIARGVEHFYSDKMATMVKIKIDIGGCCNSVLYSTWRDFLSLERKIDIEGISTLIIPESHPNSPGGGSHGPHFIRRHACPWPQPRRLYQRSFGQTYNDPLRISFSPQLQFALISTSSCTRPLSTSSTLMPGGKRNIHSFVSPGSIVPISFTVSPRASNILRGLHEESRQWSRCREGSQTPATTRQGCARSPCGKVLGPIYAFLTHFRLAMCFFL